MNLYRVTYQVVLDGLVCHLVIAESKEQAASLFNEQPNVHIKKIDIDSCRTPMIISQEDE